MAVAWLLHGTSRCLTSLPPFNQSVIIATVSHAGPARTRKGTIVAEWHCSDRRSFGVDCTAVVISVHPGTTNNWRAALAQ